jgi:hypothetical protein
MAAGLGFKTFTSGEVLTAADTNGYLMQGVMVFASASARTAAITAPTEGQYSYLKDTNSTEYYDGSAWVAGAEGDISGVTAGVGISGGGTSGTVTVTNSMATTITTKGDLVPGTGSGTFARLAAGNNGEALYADSSATTGLRYSATPSASNPVLNSAFQVWARGTSFSLAASTAYTSGFTADRWQTATGANQACTISRQATGDTTNLPNIQYALRYQRNSGQTGTGVLALLQNFESINAIPFAGKTVTMSFYARAGANYSAASSILQAQLTSGTGTDQNAFSSYTGGATVISQNATLTTTWQRFTYTGSIGATATEFVPQFNFTPVGTAGAADYYEITGVQIDIGSVALPFRTYAATIQGELAACQRYYWRTGVNFGTTPFYGTGTASSTTAAFFFAYCPVPMRVRATSLDNQGLQLVSAAGTTGTLSSPAIETGVSTNIVVAITGTSTSLTTGGFYYFRGDSADDYIGFSAEL